MSSGKAEAALDNRTIFHYNETIAKRKKADLNGKPPIPSAWKTLGPYIQGAMILLIGMPVLLFIRFGFVDGFGWGATIFLSFLVMLIGVGLTISPREENHTPVKAKGDLGDRISAVWLMACFFGPFLGWMVTRVAPLTPESWRWIYAARLFLAAGLPLISAIPLTRYLRGKAVRVGLPLLVILTMLPMLTAVNIARDLWAGPGQIQERGVLPYSGVVLK